MKTAAIQLTACLLIFAAGCASTNDRSPLEDEITALSREKSELQRRLEDVEAGNAQLTKQVQVLSGLSDKVDPEKLYDLQGVKLAGATNLYDKDEDGKKEKLIVYVQPIDNQGDIVKAAGSVDVQLWDLNKPQAEALLGQWRVERDELKKLWFATLMRTNYRLVFDVADKVAKFDEPLTVKVTFTDYSTGRVLLAQKVVKPL